MGCLARWWPAVCAVFAYLPSLASSPGRMPADTKLALYLDPARLTTEATSTFDVAQHAGWVPHQQIAYLWPSGPWYLLFDAVGISDQMAHRLWVGTIMFTAGTGVGWALRRLRFGATAALTGGLIYQLSPYLLPYVSRTSSLLLPFAGLGWILGATLLATRDTRRLPWRWPAIIALVVATVGAVNATALIVIVPGPVLMLLFAGRFERVTWSRIGLVAALTAVACTTVSLWWIVMTMIQRRHGADVLAYSESLRSVSSSSTAVETLRGLGYWLFYVRDHVGATTTASLNHLNDPATITLGFVAVLLGLLGLVLKPSPLGLLGAWSVAVGVVVAVGVHPIDDPSPFVSLIGGDLENGLALALRSSTRALPVSLFGLAIGTALLVDSAPWPSVIARRLGRHRYTATAVVVVAVSFAATPSWWTASLIDPNLERDPEVPTAWRAGASTLDKPVAHSSTAGSGTARVLQLPGAEFGAFEWGVTVDQPLPYLSDRAVVTRSLLPLGSPAAMDLVFALDDRLQEGTFESTSLAPVMRWLGADSVWVTGDLNVERYNTARPGVLLNALERSPLRRTATFGESLVPGMSVVNEELLGVSAATDPIAPVTLFDGLANIAEHGEPAALIRVGTEEVVLVGSGDGAIDAAAAGVLDGGEILLAAPAVDELADRLVITDSYRDRARHWRSSQDVHGFTESAASGSDLLPDGPNGVDEADERLPIFAEFVDGSLGDDWRTVSEQVGPVTATATGYGEPYAYLPEHRPVMAVDGEETTAWTVGEHADPVGHRIRLEVADDARDSTGLRLLQPAAPGDRTVTEVEIVVDRGPPVRVALDARSWEPPGQLVKVATPVGSILSITITAVSAGRPNGVGFSEIDLGIGPTVEWIRTPNQLPEVHPSAGIDVVVTRLRVEPTDRWRDDPEPSLRRRVPLNASATAAIGRAGGWDVTVEIRLDPRSGDDQLATWLGDPAISSARLTGSLEARGASALDGDATTSWVTPFGMPVGPALTLTGVTGTTNEIRLLQPDGPFSLITQIRITDEIGPLTVQVGDDPIALPRPIELASATITVTGADRQSIVDRRFGDEVILPAAIAELDFGSDAMVSPPSRTIEVKCESSWLKIADDDVPISFVADVHKLLSGEAVAAKPCAPVAVADTPLQIAATPPPGLQIDRVVVSIPADVSNTPDGFRGDRTIWSVPDGPDPREVTIDGCPAGCWVVLGHGFNTAWRAETITAETTSSLGEPILVDANANGWRLEPFDDPLTVRFVWTVQRPVTIAVAVSAVAVAALVVALVAAFGRDRLRRRCRRLTHQGRDADHTNKSSPGKKVPSPGLSGWIIAVSYLAACALFIGLIAVPVAAVIVVCIAVTTRLNLQLARAIALAAVGILAVVGAVVVLITARDRPFPGLGWPENFEFWHRPTLFFLVTLVAALEATTNSEKQRANVLFRPDHGRGRD